MNHRRISSTLALFSFLIFLAVFPAASCNAESTWQSIGPFGGNCFAVAVDPSDSQILYAGTWGGGIFKSVNGGAGWTPASNGGLSNAYIFSITIDPATPKTLYAATNGDWIFKSTDGGDSWTQFNSGLTSRVVQSLVIDPNNPQTLYAGTGNGVFKSSNGGSSWLPIGLTGSYINSILVDPSHLLTLYAGTQSGGVYKTTDGGTTWAAVNNGGLSGTDVYAMAFDPATSSTIYAGTYFNGAVYKSTDGGSNWTKITAGSQPVFALRIDPTTKYIYAATGAGVLKSTDSGSSWAQYNSSQLILSLAVDPGNSQTLYTGVGNGVLKSTDGGYTWNQVNSGLTNSTTSNIFVDPSNGQTLYAATNNNAVGRLFKSINGGSSWTAAPIGGNSPLCFAVDPGNSRNLYVGLNSGVFKSTDGGGSWSASGLSGTQIGFLTVDPNNSQTVYAGLRATGLLSRSTDGGGSWNNFGPTNSYIITLAIDPTTSQTLYAGTSIGVYKSTDGGATWTLYTNGLQTYTTVQSLAIDRTNTQTLYAGTYQGGVFKSGNGGSSWTQAVYGLVNRNINVVAIDPTNSLTVYTGTGGGPGGGLYKSVDAGSSWVQVNGGMAGSNVYTLAIDPNTSSNMYVGTDGKGSFKSVADGVPVISAPASAICTIGAPCSVKVSATGWPAPTMSVSGSVPGMVLDSSSGVLSGTPVGAGGSYQLIFTASTGVPPDASRAVTVTVNSSNVLNAVITAPAGTTPLASLPAITGTATGTGLSKVQVQVSDGVYYLNPDRATFSTTPTWIGATLTPSGSKLAWSVDSSAAPWVPGITYTVTVKASSSGSSWQTSSSFRLQMSGQASLLDASFLPLGAILVGGDTADLYVTLKKADDTPLSGQSVSVVVTPPATVSNPFPAPDIRQFTTDANGSINASAVSTTYGPYAGSGAYAVQVRYNGSATQQAAVSTLSLPVLDRSGYALIVVGKAPDGSQFDQHTKTATAIYSALLNKRNFLQENVIFLDNSQVPVTKQSIRDALGTLRQAYLNAPAPVYLIMIDHGSPSGFLLGSDTLTPDDPNDANNLASLLNGFESGIDPAVLSRWKRYLVVGSCFSGQFQRLGNQPGGGRVVITSSTAGEKSLAGTFDAGDGSAAPTLSGGDYFIDALFGFLGRGDSFSDAFTQAAQGVALQDPRGYNGSVPLGLHADVVDTNAQHPLFNDSGDGVGSFDLSGGANGAAVGSLYLGVGAKVPKEGSPADIAAVPPTQFLDAATSSLHLVASVNVNSRVKNDVWAEVRTPATTVTQGTVTGQVAPTSMDLVQLVFDGNNWIGDYLKFSQPGTYDVYFYTRDGQSIDGGLTYDISPMAHTRVYKNAAGNAAPAPFTLVPTDTSTPSLPFTLSWNASSPSPAIDAANTLSYTLQLASDSNFNNLVYTRENIPQANSYLSQDALRDPNSTTGGYLCQNGCWWRVRAIDKYGATAQSDSSSFSIVATNGSYAFLTGYVVDAASKLPVAGAVVGTGSGATSSTAPNGSYLLTRSSGVGYTMSVAVPGYNPSSASIVAVPGINKVQFSLSSNLVNGLCGSSNGQLSSAAPSANLCAAGSVSAAPAGAGPWSWSCLGSNGGSTASCAAPATQQINVGTAAPSSAPYNGQFTVAATATSGLGVSYSSGSPAVCGNSGATFTMLAASGSCLVQYDQGGSAGFGPAPRVSMSVSAVAASQSISFTPPANASYGGAAVALSAAASSGLPVSFHVVSGPGSLAGNQLSSTGAGVITVAADQGGSALYSAATEQLRQVTVDKAALTVRADNLSRLFNTANPPLSVSYSGFVNGDGAGALSGAPALTTTGTPSSPVGSYPITVSLGSLTSANYSFDLVNGTLTVAQDTTPYPVTGSSGGNGTISCVSPVVNGNSTTCTLTPTPGYWVFAVSGCGSSVLNGTVYTTGPITGACTVSVSFRPGSATGKPGDCNRDGAVTISEVQGAINMLLGLQAVETCVDLDGNGTVSLSEVQQVINAFLGL